MCFARSAAAWVIVSLCSLGSPVLGQATWYVNQTNCPGPGSGTVDDPFCAIQTGINAATDGDTVIVAGGLYTGTGNRNLNFAGRAITLRSANGPAGCMINCQNQGRGFLFVSGETADAVVEGFTITGCNGSTGGGGMLCQGSDPTVKECVFNANTSGGEFGGGMFNSASDPTVIGCTFSGNSGGVGAGMANVGSAPTVTDCSFIDNFSFGDFGGGMYNADSAPTVRGCLFDGNRNAGGGGMGIGGAGGGMYNTNSEPTVTDCIFITNIAEIGGVGRGGGLFLGAGDATITDCSFVGNEAEFGGGMACVLSSPTVVDCVFTENVAAGRGGGMHNISSSSPDLFACTFTRNTADRGGAMHNATNSHATVMNSLFNGNAANLGGALYNTTASTPMLWNVAFAGNRATSNGGAILNTSNNSASLLANCTFSGNDAGIGAGVIQNVSGGGASLTSCVLWNNAAAPIVGAATVAFTDVQDGFEGEGNIDLDPLFTGSPDPGGDGVWGTEDDDYGDLRLRTGSPCIDAGDPGLLMRDGDSDLDGHARVLCGRVDMGAYEFGLGDFDCDGAVDLFDFAAWVGCATGPGGGPIGEGCEAFDGDGDGDVDWADFAAFQIAIGATP